MKYFYLFIAFIAVSASGQQLNTTQINLLSGSGTGAIVTGSGNKLKVSGTDLGTSILTSSTATNLTLTGTTANSGIIQSGTINPTVLKQSGTQVGSAAFTASTAYATSAQGVKADASIQNPVPNLPNVVFYWEADQMSLAESGTVSSMVDVSGSGNNLSVLGGNTTYTLNGINGHPSVHFSSSSMTTGTSFIDSTFDKALSIWMVLRSGNNTNGFAICSANPAFQFYVSPYTSGQGGCCNISALLNGNAVTPKQGDLSTPTLITYNYDGANQYAFMNEACAAVSTMTSNEGIRGALVFGATPTNTAPQDMYVSAIVIAKGVTDKNRKAVDRYFTEKYGMRRQQIIFVGDSITAGIQGAFMQDWGQKVTTALGGSAIWNFTNIGRSGRSLSDMLFYVDRDFSSAIRSGARNVVVVEGGINDIMGSASGSTVATSMQNLCAAIRAYGVKVIATTITPFGSNGTQESTRITANALIRANALTYADALADLGADPTIGAPGSQNNATYYNGDLIHQTDAGISIAAPIITNAIKYALQVSVTGTAALTTGTATISDPNITTTQTIIPSISGTGITTPLKVSAQVTGTATITSGTTTDSGAIRYIIQP